jgi:hypothetical protein
MYKYTVPCININHITESDVDKLMGYSREAAETCCMYDPTDPGNGIFLWIDETETVSQTDPPPGYSQAFAQLWHWAQANSYSWLRVASWGDRVEGLQVCEW